MNKKQCSSRGSIDRDFRRIPTPQGEEEDRIRGLEFVNISISYFVLLLLLLVKRR